MTGRIRLQTGCARHALVAVCLWPNNVLACSSINESVAASNALAASGFYWQISILIGGLTVWIGLRARQWLLPALSTILLVFHPAWTIPAEHGPDCVFVNVEASQLVLTVISSLLAWQTLQVLLAVKPSRSQP
jgi:F0F1-type ATP synthase assembly protein I